VEKNTPTKILPKIGACLVLWAKPHRVLIRPKSRMGRRPLWELPGPERGKFKNEPDPVGGEVRGIVLKMWFSIEVGSEGSRTVARRPASCAGGGREG